MQNNCKQHHSIQLTEPSHHPPSKMFPEAHLNFCHGVLSSVLWIYVSFFFFLASMKHVLINDIRAFMALIYFPHLRNSFFPLLAVPRLCILCIIHPSLMSPFKRGFWETHISLHSFFSFCLALICTHALSHLSSCLQPRWEHNSHSRGEGRRAASNHTSPNLGKYLCSFNDQSLILGYPEGQAAAQQHPPASMHGEWKGTGQHNGVERGKTKG